MDSRLAKVSELARKIDSIGDRTELNPLLQECENILRSVEREVNAGIDKGKQEQFQAVSELLEVEKSKWYAKESRYERALILILIGMMVVALFIVARLMISRK